MYEKEVEAYLRKIDDWCKMKGLEREDWCKENDHTWDNVPVEWPPQRRCVVCGLQEERSPALVAFSSDNTCHKCGSKVIAMRKAVRSAVASPPSGPSPRRTRLRADWRRCSDKEYIPRATI